MAPPLPIRVYHITHIDNLASIVASGELRSDARMVGQSATVVGMSNIKQRRFTLPVTPHPGLNVGDCVPFYFGPRSVMLYLLHQGNHPDLSYRGGQGPILHLEADLDASIRWLEQSGRRWAFSLANAGSHTTEFRANRGHLDEINWAAVKNPDFRDRHVKEGKQAEFLAERGFPWHLIQRIGVHSSVTAAKVHGILRMPIPPVVVEPSWYY